MTNTRKLALIGVFGLAAILVWLVLETRRTSEAVSLTILGEDTATMSAIEAVKSRYEAETGTSVRCVKDTFEVLQQKANADLNSGTGLHDIILNYNFSLSSFVRNAWVLTLDEMSQIDPRVGSSPFEDQIFLNIWREVGSYSLREGSEPEVVGYPFAGNTMLLVFNKSLFEDAATASAFQQAHGRPLRAPETWSQFQEVAAFLTNPEKGIYGLVLQGASGSWLYYEWLNFAYGMGGGVMEKEFGWEGDASTPLILDSPATQEATAFYVGLQQYSAGDFLSTGQNEQVELMRTGKVAMAIMWSDVLYSLVTDPTVPELGFAPIPGAKSQIGGGIFYLNRKSTHKAAAIDFMLFLMREETQREMMRHGLCSPLRSAYDDLSETDVPYAAALKQALERGVYMAESGPDADAVQEAVTAAVQRIWRGEVSVEEGLAVAQRQLEAQRAEIFSLMRRQ